ncbi:MAG: transcription antitermination factor NusB [Clostridiales bacterium]|nr:transcription antitermination factor NusB [Clostridiales bacterium]
MSRKIARDAAMRMLYAYELTGELNQDMIQETIEPAALDAEDMKYLKQVTEGAVEQRASLDTLIEQNAVGWRLSRIGKVDLSILRLAIYEMLCREDVPESVAINEAVELAKKYSEPKSKQFINGILGSISRSKKKEEEEKSQ